MHVQCPYNIFITLPKIATPHPNRDPAHIQPLTTVSPIFPRLQCLLRHFTESLLLFLHPNLLHRPIQYDHDATHTHNNLLLIRFLPQNLLDLPASMQCDSRSTRFAMPHPAQGGHGGPDHRSASLDEGQSVRIFSEIQQQYRFAQQYTALIHHPSSEISHDLQRSSIASGR